MIENIVRRAKKLAIKRLIAGGAKGVRTQDLIDSIKQEYKEHEDLPNTTNPDDWAKISGKKGERIVFIRTLVNETKDSPRAAAPSSGSPPASTCRPHRTSIAVTRRGVTERAIPGASTRFARISTSGARLACDTLRVGCPAWRSARSAASRPSTGSRARRRDSNPIAASSVLINAYVATLDRRTVGTSRTSSPGVDARGFVAEGALPPDVETHLVNTVLTNGARYYVDHAHPEISTPECVDAREVVVFDRAAEEILQRSMVAARSLLPDGAEIIVYKNNSDGKGNSYGCHENYLLAREVPFGRIVSPDHAPLRHPPGLLRRRQGGLRGARRPEPPRCRSSSASGPTSSRRRSGSRPR